jgi:hypothetical protein
VVASRTGRWGERLSVGVTQAVALTLAAQLPNVVVTTNPPEDAPWRQVLIDVDAFEVQPDGTCVMAAEWTVRAGRGGSLVDRQRFSLVMPLAATGDPAVVAAMSHEAESLAGSIATSLRAGEPGVAVTAAEPAARAPPRQRASRQ